MMFGRRNYPNCIAKKRFIPFELRAMLLNADKTIIFGRKDALPQLTLQPIHYQEQVVGFLGLLPGKTVNQASEIRFMERQSESFIWIALLMILLSAGLALLLAYALGRPLKAYYHSGKGTCGGPL